MLASPKKCKYYKCSRMLQSHMQNKTHKLTDYSQEI